MKPLKFYKYTTAGLLLLNISMIAFFFLTAPQPPHGGGIGKKGATEILKLDEQQHKSFLKLAQQHMNQMDTYNGRQKDLLNPYFNSIIDPNKTINSDSLLHQVQSLERKKIESTYQHFQDIKAILRPEQYADFEGFIGHATKLILMGEKKNPPTSKDF